LRFRRGQSLSHQPWSFWERSTSKA
jgi:hypothetical protein